LNSRVRLVALMKEGYMKMNLILQLSQDSFRLEFASKFYVIIDVYYSVNKFHFLHF
jgi:hypothetical protein